MDPSSADVAQAIARVLDIDPGVLRADTPLADLGADDVALIAIVDLLAESSTVPAEPDSELDLLVRGARTVADLQAVARLVAVADGR